MRITRDDVLLAIESESLIPNFWVEHAEEPTCRVCAVGAVLRRAGLDNNHINAKASSLTRYSYTATCMLNRAVEEKNWLGALSIQFERLCHQAPLEYRDPHYSEATPEYVEKTVKPLLIEWAKVNLPDVVYEGAL